MGWGSGEGKRAAAGDLCFQGVAYNCAECDFDFCEECNSKAEESPVVPITAVLLDLGDQVHSPAAKPVAYQRYCDSHKCCKEVTWFCCHGTGRLMNRPRD